MYNKPTDTNNFLFDSLTLKSQIETDLSKQLHFESIPHTNIHKKSKFKGNFQHFDLHFLTQLNNTKHLENELSDNEPKTITAAIKHSFSMKIGFSQHNKRYMDMLLVFDKNDTEKPIAFICFSFFLLDSWQVHGVENNQKGIGLCCYLNYTFVKDSHQKQGIAHLLSNAVADIYFEHLVFIKEKLTQTKLTLTPIIYRGTFASGCNFLLQNIEHKINLKNNSENIALCPCITNA